MRFGTVALVGRTNVGKSTFLNAALGAQLAIVSARPQTTRDALLGVVHRDHAQIAFIDTPGLHRPRNELGRRMNAAALQAVLGADLVLFMTDCHLLGSLTESAGSGGPGAQLAAADQELLDRTVRTTPCVVVLNKVDLLRDKPRLLPTIDLWARRANVAAVIPASVLDPRDVERILDEITPRLPEGPAGYPEDMLTDRPTSFFIREYVREQVLRSAEREVPHAVAVSIDSVESSSRLLIAKATVHVEKTGQRKILLGRGGSRIRQIGIGARARLEALLGQTVHLELFVRVTPRWKNVPRQLAELGYEAPTTSLPDPDSPDGDRRAP